MKIRSRHPAFTLIELLVVISIIAILASIALPVYGMAVLNARIAAGMASARQIGLGLRLYAQDNADIYPRDRNDFNEEIITANDAYRSLFPAQLQSESVFTVASSKAGPKADNKIATPQEILARGENHWAYVMGLTCSSNPNFPLIVDHTDGSGYYNDQETEFGGTWKGTKAIVVRTDISAASVKLLGTGAKRYLPRFDDPTKNALELKDYMGDGVKLLEPAR